VIKQDGIYFTDEPAADIAAEAPTPVRSLYRDMMASTRIKELVLGDAFATLLYCALCNTKWGCSESETPSTFSFREAGDIVASFRDAGCYMDWYASGPDGLIDEQVMAELEALGWKPEI